MAEPITLSPVVALPPRLPPADPRRFAETLLWQLVGERSSGGRHRRRASGEIRGSGPYHLRGEHAQAWVIRNRRDCRGL